MLQEDSLVQLGFQVSILVVGEACVKCLLSQALSMQGRRALELRHFRLHWATQQGLMTFQLERRIIFLVARVKSRALHSRQVLWHTSLLWNKISLCSSGWFWTGDPPALSIDRCYFPGLMKRCLCDHRMRHSKVSFMLTWENYYPAL